VKICIVIPVHNESRNIGDVLDSLSGKGLGVVVIDDGSTDHSGAIAEARGAVVIRHDQKMGKGLSLKEGFMYALAEGYAGVIAMDGDGQHDAGDIDHILEKAQETSPSIVTGNRMQDNAGMPLVRLLTNRFMSGLISALCKQRIPDTQCGFRFISSQILREMTLTCNDFEIETEVLIKASRRGYKIYSVPIRTIYRNEDSKINPFKDTIRFFRYIIREIFSKNSSRN